MIFHIARREEWERAQLRRAYSPQGFEAEGFIHCSTLTQLLTTANRFFLGHRDLLLLCIDENRLTAPFRYEAAVPPAGMLSDGARERLFPHLYGELNLDAVTATMDFPCGADGKFTMPAQYGAGCVKKLIP